MFNSLYDFYNINETNHVLTVILSDAVDRMSTWSLVHEGKTVVASRMLTMIFMSLTELTVRLVLELAATVVTVSKREIVV